jgi:hypothetical protein
MASNVGTISGRVEINAAGVREDPSGHIPLLALSLRVAVGDAALPE